MFIITKVETMLPVSFGYPTRAEAHERAETLGYEYIIEETPTQESGKAYPW